MPRFSWTQPICEKCYIDRERRQPARLVEEHREVEICFNCGNATKDGIYYRVDPSTAKYPTRVKE